ncbi:MAG: hypothetical protein KKB03_01070 [Nanoarchaeota archaeon]|nr:hypothetical protein [Nanoarchaeota archaeon]MBU1134933.1 hypothetical protein [Nanoarchaeota archaeon]MBU2519818.1 hypothetical protein [Nanoarchaeota archaeon]
MISGCISVEVEQKIYDDGWTDIKITTDMSALYSSFGGTMMDMSNEELNKVFSDQCRNFLGNTTLLNSYCTPIPSEYKTVSGGRLYIGDHPSFIVTQGFMSKIYRYDLKVIQTVLSETSESQGQEITPEQMAQAKSMSELMGLSLKYVIEMPGEIKNTELGDIKNNRVEVNFFDLYESDHAYVESEESTLSILSLFVIVGIIVIIILIIVLIYSRKTKNHHKEDGWV